MTTIVDRDDYVRVEDDINKFKLDVLVGGGIYTLPQVYLQFGFGVIINNTHMVFYSRSNSDTFSYLTYAYKFSLIK